MPLLPIVWMWRGAGEAVGQQQSYGDKVLSIWGCSCHGPLDWREETAENSTPGCYLLHCFLGPRAGEKGGRFILGAGEDTHSSLCHGISGYGRTSVLWSQGQGQG